MHRGLVETQVSLEAGFYKDAKAAKLWLNLNNIPDNQIILYGESLGTAVADSQRK